jgi:hypothetical protein
MGEDGEDE